MPNPNCKVLTAKCDSFSLDISLKTVILPQKYMSAIEKILKGLRSHTQSHNRQKLNHTIDKSSITQ